MNLYELIKNLDFQGIDLKQVRRISAQILETLIFLKRQRIIHCDLKPENILIRNFSKAKINVP
jgi:dual specificity tyrosine-phosphorylation-regulated kinase 2/3/4